MKEAKITHLPGVPFHFQMMQKLRYQRLSLPDLKSLAQAGGYLDIDARRAAHDYMTAQGGRFFVMYGQTEASPRLTTLAHDDSLWPGFGGTGAAWRPSRDFEFGRKRSRRGRLPGA